MKIKIPKQPAYLLQKLEKSGSQAFIVGGCVRDSLLKRSPKDWDIATNASPQKIQELFSAFHPKQTGKETGTVTVTIDKTSYEITPFRSEKGTLDHRHPQTLSFINSITDDLSRRDFTINAMAYHPNFGLIDPYGGQDDLKNGVIRAVGEPTSRFWEDSLRILRALRFSARYHFEIAKDTKKAMIKQSPFLLFLPAERVLQELISLLCENSPTFAILSCSKPLFSWIPELEPFFQNGNDSSPFVTAVRSLSIAPNLPPIRLALLLQPLATNGSFNLSTSKKSDCSQVLSVLRRLKCSHLLEENVILFLSHQQLPCPVTKQDCLKLIRDFGENDAQRLLCFLSARAIAKGASKSEISQWKKTIKKLHRLLEKSSACWSVKQLKINGNDLLALGVERKEIGNLLEHLLDLVIEEKIPNKKQPLLQTVAQCHRSLSS